MEKRLAEEKEGSGKEYSKSCYTKHRQMCPAVVEAVVQMRPRVYKRRELRVDVE